MAVTFPTTLDSFADRSSGDTISEDHVNDLQDAVEFLEAKVGINSSAVTSSLDYLIDHIPANAVDSDAYVDGSIDLAHMSANSVDSAQYVDGSIDLIHMSVNSVDSDQYVDGSIDRVHLAADIVDGTKLSDNAINSEHYTDGSIDLEHLADNMFGPSKASNGTLMVASDGISIGTYDTTSYVSKYFFNIKCPAGPTVLRAYARIKNAVATVVLSYGRLTVTGVGSSAGGSKTGNTYGWVDLGTVDVSGLTPGTVYEVTLDFKVSANTGYVQGVSVWWE